MALKGDYLKSIEEHRPVDMRLRADKEQEDEAEPVEEETEEEVEEVKPKAPTILCIICASNAVEATIFVCMPASTKWIFLLFYLRYCVSLQATCPLQNTKPFYEVDHESSCWNFRTFPCAFCFLEDLIWRVNFAGPFRA